VPAANTFVDQRNDTVLLNYTGLSLTTLTENLGPSFGFDYTSNNIAVYFSSVFGVLFCGVTGILAGANMSGRKITCLFFTYNDFIFVCNTFFYLFILF